MLRSTLIAFSAVVVAACGGVGPDEGGLPLGPSAAEENTTPLEVRLGTGVESFEDVDDGQALPIVGGPQGGTHVWGAVLVTGASSDRIRLTFELRMLRTGDLDGKLGPLRVLLDPSADEEGAMEAAGLTVFLEDPYAIDRSDCELSVVATDADGREASDARVISPRWELP